MKNCNLITLCAFLLALLSSCGESTTSFHSDRFEMKVNQKGMITALLDKESNKDYKPGDASSALLSLRINGKYENPVSMLLDKETNQITLGYMENKAQAILQYTPKENYFTLEVLDVQSPEAVELVVWGPYPTSISQIVGECVGVVRDSVYAIGIQALNPKTIGGYPSTEDDVDPSFDIFATNSLQDVPDSLKVLYRGQTAKHTEFGSVIQAYCRDRSKDRIIEMWGHERYLAPAYNDGGVIGSKIALFGCKSAQVLDCLEQIEIGEELPHPTLDGEWVKRTPEAAQAYIIYPFNENNIDEAIAFTKRTGLKYLYHGGPFKTWGNFELNPDEFPSGLNGLKNCVDRAAGEGIKLGFHTLSNFITTNDAYVTPVPDKGLAKVGTSVISKDIDAVQTAIVIASPDFFNQMKNNSLHGVRIGDELIRYERVSDSEPWTLLNCERGAWGTKAAAHSQGESIDKLMDHGYKTFLTDIELTKEVARSIANIYNETGTRQVSFDGLEGAWSTGLGQYGLSLMMKEWYDHLKPEYRDNINDASMTTHYNWHIFTRMNWGEPWYAGFRESQMNYRLMNQDFYRRNLIPCMLGWFKLDANTGIEDIEWLLARSAAFDAGYTLVTNKENVAKNGDADQIIKAIKEWENARLSGAFPVELKREMEYIANEYTLNETSSSSWDLYPYSLQRYKHANVVRQPGEPVVSKWEVDNPYNRQPVQFLLKANDKISSVSIEIANYFTLQIPGTLEKGQMLKYTGGNEIMVCDVNQHVVRSVPVDPSKMSVDKGKSTLIFSCAFSQVDDTDKFVSAEIKTKGEAIALKATRQRK